MQLVPKLLYLTGCRKSYYIAHARHDAHVSFILNQWVINVAESERWEKREIHMKITRSFDAATSSCGMSQNNKPERGKSRNWHLQITKRALCFEMLPFGLYLTRSNKSLD
jgi:hypothetical protein